MKMLSLLLAFSMAITPEREGELPVKAVLTLTGASSIEDIESDELEIYYFLLNHPLDLNNAGESRLRSCGLFSERQLQAFLKERKNGDILSFSELSLLSGFGEDFAQALRPFTILRSASAPGYAESRKIKGEAAAKMQGRRSGDGSQLAGGLRTVVEVGERAELRWTSRTTYSDPTPGPGTISAAWYFRRLSGKIVAGNFSGRFGQGLLSWSGFSIGSLAAPGSLVRNGSGISATSSSSADHLGVAGDIGLGRWRLSSAIDLKDGFEPMLGLSRLWDRLALGINATSQGASFDWKASFENLSFFGEAAWKGGAAAVTGLMWVPAYGRRMAFRVSWYSPDYGNVYSGAALCYSNRWINAGCDAGYNMRKETQQYRALLQFKPELQRAALTLRPGLRLQSRFRPADRVPWRSELRADIEVACGISETELRYDRVWSSSGSWLVYAGQSLKFENLSFDVRGNLFCIDSWDDRIYVYEKDIPWSFSIPAYYGRGYSLYFLSSVKFLKRHRLDLRLSYTDYPWNPEPKDSRFETRAQYSFNF